MYFLGERSFCISKPLTRMDSVSKLKVFEYWIWKRINMFGHWYVLAWLFFSFFVLIIPLVVKHSIHLFLNVSWIISVKASKILFSEAAPAVQNSASNYWSFSDVIHTKNSVDIWNIHQITEEMKINENIFENRSIKNVNNTSNR